MSSAPTNRTIAYLKEVLTTDPVYGAGKIIALRNAFRGVAAPTQRDTKEQQAARQKASNIVNQLRQQFWVLPTDKLRIAVDKIDLREFPELRPAVDRLRLAATYRSEFTRLASHPKVNINLLNTLKRVVMAEPREAGALKAEYLRKLGGSSVMGDVKTMVHMMYREFPEVYRLEQDWFHQMSKTKGRVKSDGSATGVDVDFELPVPGWVLIIGIFLIIRILIAVLR